MVDEGLSVRVTERLVKLEQQSNKSESGEQATNEPNIDRDTARLQEAMTSFLGAKTIIKHNVNGQGTVVINYGSLEELDGIVTRFDINKGFSE